MYRPPFPWPGGKRAVAQAVVERLGGCDHWIEPFAGSLAVLLSTPPHKFETVNDVDGLVINFWRATQADSTAVARWAAGPISELDLTARNNAIFEAVDGLANRLRDHPAYYDARLAGWWLYVRCTAIGFEGLGHTRWSSRMPNLHNGRGMHADWCEPGYLDELAYRIAHMRICCGDWSRVVAATPLRLSRSTAVFLDPPYQSDSFDARVYASDPDPDLYGQVAGWAAEHGRDPNLRIALCGYAGSFSSPGWTEYAWTRNGGFANTSKTSANDERQLERIWFSPGCRGGAQPELW